MIFGCTNSTYPENMRRRLFGLPKAYHATVQKVRVNTALFLLNFETRRMRRP